MVTDLRLSVPQERSIAQSTARINIWDGSVRSGKTIGSLLRWLMYVANAPRGGALVVVGKTYETVSRNVFGPLTDPAIVGAAVAKLIKYTRGAPTATILGRTIEVITANDVRAEARLRGMTAAGAYVDEATLLPENFWDQLLARLSVSGAKLFATTNPDNPGHWLRKKFILRAGELDLGYWHFTIEDNHTLDPKYVASLKKEFTGLWYRRFILGHWVQAEGAVYDMWDPERHVVDILPRIERWIGLGIDYGTVNPFAGLLLGLGERERDGVQRLYLTNEYRYDSKASRRSKTDAEYSVALTKWLDGIKHPGSDPEATGVYPEWTVVDPSAASFVQQLYRDGRVTPTLANNAVTDGIRNVSTLLATDRLKVHRSCTGWIDEIGGYSWDDKAAAKGEDKPVKADDHSLDAGRYVVHTTESAWRQQIREAA